MLNYSPTVKNLLAILIKKRRLSGIFKEEYGFFDSLAL